ncbi:MAG: aldo/keto reductase [Chitinophagaceae bacterium]|nr:aldo/keto reductase [Chitinophagaceae bacterium]
MEYRDLGSSSLKVSAIGFGCMSLKQSEKENILLLQSAVDAGINFFDTADLYDKGDNEKVVGKALKEKRKQLIIATKVGNQWRDDGSGWDWNPRKEYILKAVEESLKRLQTDYIDLYQLHGGTIEDPIEETIEAFEILKTQGKILFYGISSIRPNVIREYIDRSNITSILMQYSLLDRRPEEACVSLITQNKIGLLSRGALAQGILAGKPAKDYLYISKEKVEEIAALVNSLSNKDRSPAQTAIRFILQQPGLSSAIIGIRTREQLDEVVQTLQTPELTAEELTQLKKIAPAGKYEQHR